MTTYLVNDAQGLRLEPVTARVRLLARVRAARWDAELARGADPASSAVLAVRAAMLVRPSYRHRLAGYWAGVPDRGATLLSGALHDRAAVASAHHHIEAVVAALKAEAPVDPRGVAAARVLLTDGGGPLFRPRPQRTLAAALAEVVVLLDPTARIAV